jgi:CheY-like chemotaxis protein
MARVLAVDDTPANLIALDAVLSDRHELVHAGSGPEAIAILRRDKAIDVILMDVQMPGMDGLTATVQLKADPATSAIPVIAVTAHAMAGDSDRALDAGCVAYVSKPVSRARLFDAMDLALGGAGWRPAPSP